MSASRLPMAASIVERSESTCSRRRALVATRSSKSTRSIGELGAEPNAAASPQPDADAGAPCPSRRKCLLPAKSIRCVAIEPVPERARAMRRRREIMGIDRMVAENGAQQVLVPARVLVGDFPQSLSREVQCGRIHPFHGCTPLDVRARLPEPRIQRPARTTRPAGIVRWFAALTVPARLTPRVRSAYRHGWGMRVRRSQASPGSGAWAPGYAGPGRGESMNRMLAVAGVLLAVGRRSFRRDAKLAGASGGAARTGRGTCRCHAIARVGHVSNSRSRRRKPEAQRWFNQALMLTFGFNHDAAERSYLKAAQVDPDCAMCWWGAALVLGPHVNAQMDPADNPKAWQSLQRAVSLAPAASAQGACLYPRPRSAVRRKSPDGSSCAR